MKALIILGLLLLILLLLVVSTTSTSLFSVDGIVPAEGMYKFLEILGL